MDILKKAVNQAVTLLNSCGARYHIIEADGTVHGAPVGPEKRRRARRDLNLPSYRNTFRERIAPMKTGDIVVLEPAPGDSVSRLQSNVGAFGVARFGRGALMTTRNGDSVEVLRVK